MNASVIKIKETWPYALASAFLLWLAWPPHSWTAPLLLIALLPLFIVLEKIEKAPAGKKGKTVFLTAGLAFFIWNTASIFWVFNAINSVNTGFLGIIVSLFVSLIPFGLGAVLLTTAFWLFTRLKKKTPLWLAYTGLISFYVAMEYLHQTWDLSFPWMTLGNGFAGLHQWIQWYEYTGVYGGTIWILLSNILLFETYKAIRQRTGKIPFRPIIASLAWIILPVAFSLYTYARYEEKKMPANVVVVQPNIDPYQKFGSTSVGEQLDILTKLSDSVGQVNTEYFIWPETAIPNYADEEQIHSNPEYLRAQSFLQPYKNASLISGLESVKWYRGKQSLSAKPTKNPAVFYDNFNTAIQIENSPEVKFYHKSKLVPGVEKLPFPKLFSFLTPVFAQLGGSVSGWGWQEDPGIFYSRSGIGVTPVICYESLWGDWIGEAVLQGAQFIAVITNDGWWGNTPGKDQHLMYAKLRAIESRRWVARSANTGISAFINQRGDVVKQSSWWTRTALKADINLNDQLTPYVKHGDLLAKIGSFAALSFLLILPIRSKIRS